MSFDVNIAKRMGDRRITAAVQSDDRLIAITGASGIGKTTLLNCIAGLATPDAGHIKIGGRTLFDHAGGVNLPPNARGCGYVFQDSRLFPHMKVMANLTYGLTRQAQSAALLSIDEVIDLLGINHLLDRRPAALSGGETKRVAIGRALLSAPALLLLDEPLASLDGSRAGQVLCAIERIRDELQVPIVFVSHDRGEVGRLTKTILAMG